MSKNKNIKFVIGNNIAKLRQASGMTQLQLAEQLNYSDKTISKWERGEGVPDIAVLIELTDIFGITLDYLTREHDTIELVPIGTLKKAHWQARTVITFMSLILVWLVATLIFVVVHISSKAVTYEWLAYIYAVPITMIVWLVLNSIWFNKKRNYLIITFLMWSCLLSLVITFLTLDHNVAIVLLLGIPGQAIIFLWSGLGTIAEKLKNEETSHNQVVNN